MKYIRLHNLALSLTFIGSCSFVTPAIASPLNNCVIQTVMCNGGSSTSFQSSNGRIDQTDRSQYVSQQEWATWHGVSCSAASMVYVLNGLGGHYIIHDVLQAETGQISTKVGLFTGFDGIAKTVNNLGFYVVQGPASFNGLAASKAPVIISMQSSEWPGGHVLVVTGGDTSNLQVMDPWTTNKTSISRSDFSAQWTGLSALVTKGVAQ